MKKENDGTKTPRMKTAKKTNFIVKSAVIAAAYAALTLAMSPIGYGSVQLRLSEALTVLAFFSPPAVVGLTVGCAIANLWSPFGVVDIVFGALATLLAALCTYFMPKKSGWKFIAPLPSVVFNALIVSAVITLSTSTGTAFWPVYLANVLSVGLPQLLVCYVAGLPLLLYLDGSGLGKKYL